MNAKIYHFETSAEAYESAQTDEAINDGDVLIIEPEGVVALVGDFPIAVTEWTGELHDLAAGDTLESLGFSDKSIALARDAAKTLGFPLAGDRDPADEERLEILGDDVTLEIMIETICEARDSAERKAWKSLAGYKFEMFGYWASSWVKYNQLLPKGRRSGNAFKRAVELARESRDELARSEQ